MKTLHYPVVTWEDAGGGWTACLADAFHQPAAWARSEDEALRLVREGLARQGEDGWLPETEFAGARLVSLVVPVRARYRGEGRVYPTAHPVPLRVDCVQGSPGRGLAACAIPRLGIRFHYDSPSDFRDLVRHFVREALRDEDPGTMATRLPPRQVRLREIAVRARVRRRGGGRREPGILEAIADALDDRRGRGRFGPAWERETEVRNLVERLGPGGGSVLLLGETGSGKTTVLAEAARRRRGVDGAGPGAPPRFWLTSGGRLIAGLPWLGQWEARCEEMIAELAAIGAVLCIENLLDLLASGGGDPRESVAAFLAPYVENGELRLVVEATPSELAACRTRLPGFADLLRVERVDPLDSPRAVRVLERLAAFHGTQHGIETGRGVESLVAHLFRRFLPYAALPGPAAAFLGDLFEAARRDRRSRVDVPEVLEAFRRRTGLPDLILRDDVPLDPAALFERLRGRIRGQDEACRVAVDVVAALKAALVDPERPIATLLFSGPTGVGKTALGSALADTLFGQGEDSRRLVRLDMSEYSGPWAVERLLGTPSAEGELVRRVREQPFVVVLLDEIEKAAPEVFDALLGLLDEGRLTDPLGRTTWFRSAIVVLTTNLGARTTAPAGFAEDPGPDHAAAIEEFFRPEFVNRIDEVVPFRSLSRATVREIVAAELAALAGREGLARSRLSLEWSEEVVDHLAEEGYDERYGARPLQRAIETRVVAPLARYLVEHPGTGDGTLRLEWRCGGVEITPR